MGVGVIGGGASGMMAAIALARGGEEVELFEKNEKLGKKLYITGKGRCNVTNACSAEEFFGAVVHGEKYLRSAYYTFPSEETMRFFEELGVQLVVERGKRVFPASGKSSDIIRALAGELKRLGVKVRLDTPVDGVKSVTGGFLISAGGKTYPFDEVIVATGGASYPSTGSTGDGYKIAKNFGHEVVPPRPALAGILTKENVSSLEGLSLKNVSLAAYGADRKLIAEEFGELLFTKKGVSGPVALTLSSYITRQKGCSLSLDLKPALDLKTVENRLIREFAERSNQELKNVLRALMPARLNDYVLERAGIDGAKQANSVLKEERARLAATIKDLAFKVSDVAPFSEAVITSGGVSIGELKPSGESKRQAGLYFVGETVDVDALTGGFNLQIAFSSAYLAAKTILGNKNKQSNRI